MLKKLLAIATALVLTLAFAACSNDSGSTSGTESSKEPSKTTEESTETESKAEEELETPSGDKVELPEGTAYADTDISADWPSDLPASLPKMKGELTVKATMTGETIAFAGVTEEDALNYMALCDAAAEESTGAYNDGKKIVLNGKFDGETLTITYYIEAVGSTHNANDLKIAF